MPGDILSDNTNLERQKTIRDEQKKKGRESYQFESLFFKIQHKTNNIIQTIIRF